MRSETEQLIASISTEEAEKMYDNLVKQMFRNKEIMAPILKMVVPEYKDCSLEEIIACMDDIAFEDIPVSDIKSMQIKGEDTELSSIEEKVIRYDLLDIIMIRRGDESSDEQILDYLNSLMKADLPGIRTYSNIEWSEKLEKEGDYMLGFADSLLRKTKMESEARGKAEGKVEGRAEGKVEGKTEEMQANIRSMQQNGLSAETIAQYLNKSVDVVKSLML